MRKKRFLFAFSTLLLTTPFALTACTTESAGKDGAQWYRGRTDVEQVTEGKAGDFYIDTDDYILYQKNTDGTWAIVMTDFGKPGSVGKDGENGTDGSEWLTGSKAPTNSLGKNGDLYLDQTYWDAYKKTDGEWEWLGNIKGFNGVLNAETYYPIGQTPNLTLSHSISGVAHEIPVTKDMYVHEPNWNCPGTYKAVVKYGDTLLEKTVTVTNWTEISLTTKKDYKLIEVNEALPDVGFNELIDYTDISQFEQVKITCSLWKSGTAGRDNAIIFYDASKNVLATYEADNLTNYGVTLPSCNPGYSYNVDGVVLPTNGAKYVRFSNKIGTGTDDQNANGYRLVTPTLFGLRQGLTGDDTLSKSTANVNGTLSSFRASTDNLVNSAQGGATYGKYLFQFSDHMKQAFVLDMQTGNIVDEIAFSETNSQYHCNNVNFGKELYAGTEFPLLYVSMENANQHKALVYAVQRTGNDFNFTLKQTITYPSNTEAGMHYQNCFVDGENGYLYVAGYTQNNWQTADNGNKLLIKRHLLPTLDNENVLLNESDALATLTLNFAQATQGGFIKEGKLYQVFGVSGDRLLRIINLQNSDGSYQELNLNTIGLTEEPECVYAYNGDYYITTVSENILKLTINA